MAANIETMFSVREKPWHYSFTSDRTKIIQEAPNSHEALIAAGLDWQVIPTPVYREDGTEIKGFKANIRDKDNKVLGIVTDRYKIVQNNEAFEFTDALIGETEDGVVRYETAGSLLGGKKTWMLAKFPTKQIVGDDVEPYLCFANSFDGTGAIQICATPIRVVCNNTLNLALSSAKRKWSTKHIGNMDSKLEEARMCLRMNEMYMNALDEESDKFANEVLYKEQVDDLIAQLFPIEDDMTERKKASVESLRADYQICYFAPDIMKFGESKWRAINAMTDMVTHAAPKRMSDTFQENRWGKIMDGDAILDKFVQLVRATSAK